GVWRPPRVGVWRPPRVGVGGDNKHNPKTTSDRLMIEFIIRERVENIGDRKGQRVYYASPKASFDVTWEEIVWMIVQRTSLTRGDVTNAAVSLAEIVCEGLSDGRNIDLGELGRLVVTVPSRRMDSPRDVTAEKALKDAKITFYPTKAMLEALRRIEMRVTRKTP
ncbi:MAG: hypothetical protein LUC33_03110, partial [Prevotellaceae bacterium]|nr:hypothetical protein [Prevotellaceae bacterium]